ncbi:MAG: hypothetical protein K9L30_18515 [Desulfobacterales bacterium]|nr:hypothetical protein [Desulfobacterales bacterium]
MFSYPVHPLDLPQNSVFTKRKEDYEKIRAGGHISPKAICDRSGFHDIKLSHPGVQGAAVEPENIRCTVFPADFPVNWSYVASGINFFATIIPKQIDHIRF